MNPKKDTDRNLALSLALQSLFARSRKTLKDVSKETGITFSALSRTNNFERAITYLEVCSLCDCFGITVSQFQGLVEEKMLDTSLLSDFRNLKIMKREMKSRL